MVPVLKVVSGPVTLYLVGLLVYGVALGACLPSQMLARARDARGIRLDHTRRLDRDNPARARLERRHWYVDLPRQSDVDCHQAAAVCASAPLAGGGAVRTGVSRGACQSLARSCVPVLLYVQWADGV